MSAADTMHLPTAAGYVDVDALTLREMAAAVRDGRIAAGQLAARGIDRTRAVESRLRAWAWFDPDRALELAVAADRRAHARGTDAPLLGIGIALKDVIHASGLPTGMGSPIYDAFVADRSASCVVKLEAAGAYVLGKTATCEFATQHPPATTNPWNGAHTPGGSSSGSAAAVAAGLAPAALGSQTRGSTIRPAVYCGIVGFKPSYGRISRAGMLETSATLDQVGLFTRSIDDAWLLTCVLQGPDVRDGATLAHSTWSGDDDAIRAAGRAPRLAAVRTPAWCKADATQQALFEMNCRALGDAGALVDAVELPRAFDDADEATRTIQLAEIARNFADLYERSGERMTATFRALCERGAAIEHGDYQRALDLRTSLQQALAGFIGAYDAIVTPPATGEAPRTLASTGDASFCSIWTLCGVPAVAFPTALGPHRMPMGLQVVGAFAQDRHLLEVAQWCRAHLPFHARPVLETST
jgi:Asp-tRNA(Asn)/Glu-tRNA(Gln) amidotransferase A subunit family amidase